MRVLLNITAEELQECGGDFTLYRSWLRLSDERVSFRLLPSCRRRRIQALSRKVCEKLVRVWEPPSLRRRLYLASRFLPLPQEAARDADLILSHILFPAPSAPWGIPVIWSSQGIAPASYYEQFARWRYEDVVFLYRFLGHKADALLIATRSGAREVLRWCPELEEKIHVVSVPVFALPVSEPKPSQRDHVLRLLFVGMDPVRKGLPELLRAYAWVRRRYPRLHLDIVTRQEDARGLREISARIPEQGVSWHPPLPHEEVLALMARADLFILPTRADTYALSAVEAMAHGCAVIVSRMNPLPELFPEADVGFLIAPGDSRELAQRLEFLVTHPEHLRQMQARARQQYLAVHEPSRVRQRLLSVFEHVLTRTVLRHPPKRRTFNPAREEVSGLLKE